MLKKDSFTFYFGDKAFELLDKLALVKQNKHQNQNYIKFNSQEE
jgi:hypothetical protein